MAGSDARPDRSARAALVTFVAVLAGALAFLAWVGRYRWFFLDEWDFLAGRDGGDVEDLLIPHNEHWSTLPIIAYRVLFNIFGLRTYLPYRAILLVLHIVAAVLLRVIMRRAGVNPWIATAAASLFVLFGSGYANLTGAFQMSFVGSLVLGLVHLLLADHDGRLDRRDWIGLAAGFAGLLSSGVALAMIPVVGVATLVRRGWRIALLHTVPLATVYVIWLRSFRDRRTALLQGYPDRDWSSPGDVISFVWSGVEGTFDAMGQLPGAGWLLGALLVVGLVLAWGRSGWSDVRKRAAAPGALLVGGAFVFVSAGLVRATDFGADYARQSRYLYLFAALALPAIAVAADAVARRWRVLTPAVLALLLVGIPGNVDTLLDRRRADRGFYFAYSRLILTLPRVPFADDVPRSVHPESRYTLRVPLGWFLDEAAAGRIPEPATIRPEDEATASLVLALNQQPEPPELRTCRNASTPLRLHLSENEGIGIRGIVDVVYVTRDGARSRLVRFDPTRLVITPFGLAAGRRLVALTGPLTLEVESAAPNKPVALCAPEG